MVYPQNSFTDKFVLTLERKKKKKKRNFKLQIYEYRYMKFLLILGQKS